MTHTVTARNTCLKRGWSPLNVILMIAGFIIFWPLGLAMLAWIIWGDEIGRMFFDARAQFRGAARSAPFSAATTGRTGNLAFDEYRTAELKRLAEERRKLEEMRAEFEGFVNELRRAKDQEEFERFMAGYRASTNADEVEVAAAKSARKGRKSGKKDA
jgi:nitrogen fixation protein FixH